MKLLASLLLVCAFAWVGCDLSSPMSPEEGEGLVASDDNKDIAIYYNQGPEAFIPVPGGRSGVTNAGQAAAAITAGDNTTNGNQDSANNFTPKPDEVWLPGDGDEVTPDPDGVVSNPTDPGGEQEEASDPGIDHGEGKVVVPVVVRDTSPPVEGGEDPVGVDGIIDDDSTADGGDVWADSAGGDDDGEDHVPAEEVDEDGELIADDVIE